MKYKSECNVCKKVVYEDKPKLFTNCVKCKKAFLAKIYSKQK